MGRIRGAPPRGRARPLALALVTFLALGAGGAGASRIEPPDPLRELRSETEKSLSERYSAILRQSQLSSDLHGPRIPDAGQLSITDPALEVPSPYVSNGLPLLRSEADLLTPSPSGGAAAPVVAQRHLDALRGTLAAEPAHRQDQSNGLRAVLRPFVNDLPAGGGAGGLGGGIGGAGGNGSGGGNGGGPAGGRGQGPNGDANDGSLPFIDDVMQEFAAMLIAAVLSPEAEEDGKITFSIFGFGKFELIRLRDGEGFRLLEHENDLAITFDSPTTHQEVEDYEERQIDGVESQNNVRGIINPSGARGVDFSLREFVVYVIMKALTEPVLYAFAAVFGLLLLIARNRRRA